MKTILPKLLCIFLSIQLTAQVPQLEWLRGLESNYEKRIVDGDLDASGDIFLKGFFKTELDFDPGVDSNIIATQGIGDGYLMKLSKDGDFNWVEVFQHENVNTVSSIKWNKDELLVSGHRFDLGRFESEMRDSNSAPLEVNYINLSYDMDIDPDGNILLIGSFNNEQDFDPSPRQLLLTPTDNRAIFVAKLSPVGELIWVNKIDGSSYPSGKIIKSDSEGNIYAIGDFPRGLDLDPLSPGFEMQADGATNTFGVNTVIIKYDSEGNRLWAEEIGGIDDSEVWELAIDANDELYIIGTYEGQLHFKNSNISTVYGSQGGDDLFIAKLDQSGNYLWHHIMGGHLDEYFDDIVFDRAGNIIVVGSFYGAVDFDPTSNINVFTSHGFTDAFMQRYRPDGRIIDTYQIGGPRFDYGTVARIDHQNNLILLGQYGQDVDFALGSEEAFHSSKGNSDTFIAKYSLCNSTSSTITQSICGDSSFEGYTVSGTYEDLFIASSGCDSTRTLILTVLPNVEQLLEAEICEGSSFEGYTTSGTYEDLFTGSNGCDSTRTLALTVLPNVEQLLEAEICEDSSYEGYTTSGTYEDLFTGSNGCDSTRTLALTVLPNIEESLEETICEGSSFEGYTISGTYEDQFTSSNGCDSTRTLLLTVLLNVEESLEETICEGSSFEGYTISGTYEDQFTSSNGCDSTRTLFLTVLPNIEESLEETICEGSSFEGYTISGTYEDQFTSSNGCDSTRTLFLTVLLNVEESLEETICEGSSFEGYTTSGTYEDLFTASNGCDSMRTLILTFLLNVEESLEETICEGSSFEGYSVSGTYEDLFTASNGCDSIRILNLTVLPNSDPACMSTSVGAPAPDYSIKIYPNPANELVYLESTVNDITFVQILDYSGKQIFQERRNVIKSIDVSELNNGIYI